MTASRLGSLRRYAWRGAAARATLGLALLAGTACEREERRFTEMPPTATPVTLTTVSDLQPGPVVVNTKVEEPYADNAWAVSEGQRLYNQMNCSGCHFQGGGGIGPPLMDDEWIYGSDPQQIFATIAEGRPNGMPAWKYALSNQQTWEIVAYVRSLSAQNPKGARGGRTDHMPTRPAPMQTQPARPQTTTIPKAP